MVWGGWISFGDSKAISFALSAEGLDPREDEVQHVTLFLIWLNIPDYIRKKAGTIFLPGIIPGHKKPKNMVFRNAKYFNNCIHRPFVTSLLLSQVSNGYSYCNVTVCMTV